MSKRKLNNIIKPFDIVITDDKNFSNDNFSKGVNRRWVPISINKKQGKMIGVKGHSTGKNEMEISKRNLKVAKGQLLKVTDQQGKEFLVENMLIDKFYNGDKIPNEYSAENRLFPSSNSVNEKYRNQLYDHITNNRKQRNTSQSNRKKLKKFKSNKKKK